MLGIDKEVNVWNRGNCRSMKQCEQTAGVRRMTIKGLDELMRKMKELERATAALDGEITTIRFNPHDPQSIELAIQQTEAAIDERVGDYSNNDMVESIVSQMKERYRHAILERAAEGRAGEESGS